MGKKPLRRMWTSSARSRSAIAATKSSTERAPGRPGWGPQDSRFSTPRGDWFFPRPTIPVDSQVVPTPSPESTGIHYYNNLLDLLSLVEERVYQTARESPVQARIDSCQGPDQGPWRNPCRPTASLADAPGRALSAGISRPAKTGPRLHGLLQQPGDGC